MPDIAVIGLGARGAAMGRALRAAGASVGGYDPHPPTAKLAAQAGALDDAAPSLAKAVAGARIIILAAPLAEMRDALAAVGEAAPEAAVVTDVCLLKTPVTQWAAERLPASVPFVGGCPIIRDADAASPLDGAAYAITADAGAPPEAVEAVAALAKAAGAEPFFADAAEHDSFVIATEYLPRIAAAAALDAATGSPAWRDARRTAGAAFAAAVRAAEFDPAELAIAMEYAPDALRARLDGLAAALEGIAALAGSGASAADEEGWEGSARRLADQAEARRARLEEPPSEPQGPPLERPSLSSLLLGDWLGGERRRR